MSEPLPTDGQLYWTDIARALREVIDLPIVGVGLRPMLVQAVAEIEQMRNALRRIHSDAFAALGRPPRG